MPTSVSLGSYYEDYVRNRLLSGRYNNVSAVVRAGLRLLEQHEEEREPRIKALLDECEAVVKRQPWYGRDGSRAPHGALTD